MKSTDFRNGLQNNVADVPV